jgi:hypothetical protein
MPPPIAVKVPDLLPMFSAPSDPVRNVGPGGVQFRRFLIKTIRSEQCFSFHSIILGLAKVRPESVRTRNRRTLSF